MGLFDAFRGGQAPGMYAPWMTYDPGAPQITPSQPVTPAGPLDTSPQSVTTAQGAELLGPHERGRPEHRPEQVATARIMGASAARRSEPSFANMQNSMMEQGKLALSNQLARQRMGFTNAIMGQIAGRAGLPLRLLSR
jgi:hypothetical protein